MPGAFDDVCLDYFLNPDRFKVAMQFRVEVDNPNLAPAFIESPYLPDSDLPYQWAHIYYVMFERAAKKIGIPPLQVLDKTASQHMKIQILKGEDRLFNKSSEETIKEIKADWEKRKARDRAFSPELGKFWDSVETDIQGLLEQGEDEETILLNFLMPITTLQALLQKQQDTYSLTGAYSLK